MYVCMYVCMCVYVCNYVCMYVCMCTYLDTSILLIVTLENNFSLDSTVGTGEGIRGTGSSLSPGESCRENT